MFRLPLPLPRPRRTLSDPATALAGAVFALAFAGPLAASPADLGKPDLIEQVPLRDGARLHTQVHLPPGDGPFPAILVRTPYGVPTQISGPVALDEEAEEDPAALLATWAPVFDRGYAVVFQNIRGRGLSGGIDQLFTTEREDGADTAAWLTAQPWSDGTFVLTGDSADGFAGLLTAAARPEGLRGGFFQASCGNLMREGVVRRTGGLQMESLAPWIYAQVGDSGPENLEMLAGLGIDPEAVEEEAGALFGTLMGDDPAAAAAAFTSTPAAKIGMLPQLQPVWTDFVTEAGQARLAPYFDTAEALEVPILHVGLWQDIFLDCTIDVFARAEARAGNQHLVVLDGTHYDIDDPATWPDGFAQALGDWLDALDGTQPMPPKVRYVVENAAAPEVLTATAWPPATAGERVLYLQPGGGLEAAPQAGALGRIVADPADPTPTLGGRNLFIEAGTADQTPILGRDDVLLFQGAPLAEDMVIAGQVTLDLAIRAEAQDADVVGKLVAISSDGTARLIVETLMRARYRDGREAPKAVVPGAEVPLTLALGHTAHRLVAGERLAVILQGANAPRWDSTAGLDSDPALSVPGGPLAFEVLAPAAGAALRLSVLDAEGRG